MNEVNIIGLDLAKNVFQLHGATMSGHLKFRKTLTGTRFRQFLSDHLSSLVVMEMGWLPLSLNGIAMCQDGGVVPPGQGGGNHEAR